MGADLTVGEEMEFSDTMLSVQNSTSETGRGGVSKDDKEVNHMWTLPSKTEQNLAWHENWRDLFLVNVVFEASIELLIKWINQIENVGSIGSILLTLSTHLDIEFFCHQTGSNRESTAVLLEERLHPL